MNQLGSYFGRKAPTYTMGTIFPKDTGKLSSMRSNDSFYLFGQYQHELHEKLTNHIRFALSNNLFLSTSWSIYDEVRA